MDIKETGSYQSSPDHLETIPEDILVWHPEWLLHGGNRGCYMVAGQSSIF